MEITGLESDDWRVERREDGELLISGFGSDMIYAADNEQTKELGRMLITLAVGENLEI